MNKYIVIAFVLVLVLVIILLFNYMVAPIIPLILQEKEFIIKSIENQLKIVTGDRINDYYLSSAMWMQAFIASITALITLFGVSSIFLIKKQNKLQQKTFESTIYRNLISEQFIKIKQAIHSKELKKIMDEIENKIKHEEQEIMNNLLLDEIRRKVKKSFCHFIFNSTSKQVTLEDIELLINEYNYLSMLIENKTLSKNFATDLCIENFKNVYKKLIPFINVRRNLSKKYANHYIKYVESSFDIEKIYTDYKRLEDYKYTASHHE